jgi:hypothetical protein
MARDAPTGTKSNEEDEQTIKQLKVKGLIKNSEAPLVQEARCRHANLGYFPHIRA